MSDKNTRLEELSRKLTGLKDKLKLGSIQEKILKLEGEASRPDLWKEDQQQARAMMQELSDLKKEHKDIKDLSAELKLMNELPSDDVDEEDIKSLENRISKFTLKTFLSGEHDKKNAIVSIHAGQGGTEAMDWVSMLYRMYLKYCEGKDWKVAEIESTAGEEAGLKSVSLNVLGRYAYGYLKNEAGTHRLVRQSPFNADKLRQTSFALVEVLPELKQVDLPEIKINEESLDWQFFRSSGHGGQNVNKVSTAVRLIHKPSGIVVTAQAERSQNQNRQTALDLLRSRLWLMEKVKAEGEKKKLKGEYRPASWGTQIRSYVLHPYKMVKDLRTKVEVSDTVDVLAGGIDPFVEAEIKLDSK